MNKIVYKKYQKDLQEIDWSHMKAQLSADHFDNGRDPIQLQKSFENSYASVIAYDQKKIVGTARVLSDGICNAYVVDVWTLSVYRHQGIATTMMKMLLEELAGQHVYLFTDDASDFYKKLGFQPQPEGLGQVIGKWLENP